MCGAKPIHGPGKFWVFLKRLLIKDGGLRQIIAAPGFGALLIEFTSFGIVGSLGRGKIFRPESDEGVLVVRNRLGEFAVRVELSGRDLAGLDGQAALKVED